MSTFKPFAHPDLSLWQSALEQTIAGKQSAGDRSVRHPDTFDGLLHAAAAIGNDLKQQAEEIRKQKAEAGRHRSRFGVLNMLTGEAAAVANGFKDAVEALEKKFSLGHKAGDPDKEDPAKYCSKMWWQIARATAEGRHDEAQKLKEEVGRFGTCDPRYADAVVQYAEFRLKHGAIPYKVWTKLDDFIVEGQLPKNAKVAIVGDWGTGQPSAKAMLEAIARKKPDVVIHLGDVYYAGTDYEVDNYFLKIWNSVLNLPASGIHTFSLAGNHDMYSGGKPYYRMIQELGQPASYFCLRNDDWQFVALDTGRHDDDNFHAVATYLEQTEVEWLKHKIDTAGRRRTVLLSHNQLFTAYESIGGSWLNKELYAQVGPFLPKVTAWIWGHEHNQVIYEPYQGVLGRCLGHGAYPVGITELPDTPEFTNVPRAGVTLAKANPFYSHGYAIMDLDGPSARLSYYQDSDPEDKAMFTEEFKAGAAK